MVMQRLNTGTTGKIFKMILLAVLFAAVAGLVLTDVGGFFRGGVGRQDVARIGSKSIGLNGFAQSYQRALQQSGMAPEDARRAGAPFMLLQQEVGREVLLQAAHKAGVRISDEYIATELKTQLEQVKQPGTAQEKLDMLLQQRGMSQKMFVDLVRGDYAINILNNASVGAELNAPVALMTALHAADKQKRVAHVVTITPDKIKGAQGLDDKAVKAFFDENKDHYKTIETRDIALAVLPKNTFAQDVTIADSDVKAYYDEHQKEFMNADRVRLEQVIAKNEEDAEMIADNAKTSLKSAADKKGQYVPTDWYTKNTLPAELQKAIYANKKAGLIGPVQTSIGWHVLNIERFEDGKPKSFSEVKETLARQLKDEKLDEQMAQFSDQLDGLISSGQNLAAIAEEYKARPVRVNDLNMTNAADKIKAAKIPEEIVKRVAESAFALEDDEISPLIDMPNGDYALIQVEKINAATVPAFEKIKDRVTADARKSNQEKSLIAYAEKIIGEYDTRKPDTFLKAVQKNGLNAETTSALTQSQAESTLGAGMGNLLFSLTPSNRLSFTNSPDKVNLVFLKEIASSDDKPSDTDLSELKKKTGEMLSAEIHQQFMQAWQDDIGVAINNDLVKKQFVDVQ